MNPQLTVRLPQDLNDGITDIARRMRLKRSDIVRMAIQKFIAELEGKEEERPYDRVRKLVGRVETGISDLGERHREYLIERVRKHA